MSEIIKSWDFTPPSGTPSVLSVEHSGQCIDFSFQNTVVPINNTEVVDYEGHVITILSTGGPSPENISIAPSAGWEVVTQSPIEAADWATTIITICQQLLG
jgi:hypothetical protein